MIPNDNLKNSLLHVEINFNSEAEEFKSIANLTNIKFYKRNPELASNSATNDEFSLDFINSVDCSILVQLLPTSPFIKTSEIDNFINLIRWIFIK